MIGFAVLLLCTVGLTISVLRVRVLRSIAPAASPASRGPSDLSVIIPARNEADNLKALLADLRSQTVAPKEIVVVDDESSDATASIASAAGARVIATGTRPNGWNPKVWALTVGAEASSGSVLCFLDADVRLAPSALGCLGAELQQCGGLVSVAPQHLIGAPVEVLSLACNVIAVAGGGPGFRPGPDGSSQGAVGSCVVIAADDYARAGGHAASPATIVDDLRLAAAARAMHIPVTLRRGGAVVSMRSYPSGLRSIVDGWSKNLAAGAATTQLLVGLAVSGWLAALMLPGVLVALGQWSAAAVLWVLGSIHSMWLARRVGRFGVAAAMAMPVIAAFTTFVTVRSVLLRFLRRDVEWRGRRLSPSGLEHIGARR